MLLKHLGGKKCFNGNIRNPGKWCGMVEAKPSVKMVKLKKFSLGPLWGTFSFFLQSRGRSNVKCLTVEYTFSRASLIWCNVVH